MIKRYRGVAFLLAYHLLIAMAWLLHNGGNPGPVWAGSLCVWAIPTLPFTWSLTIGLMIGPSRKRRGLLWLCLLSLPVPLQVIVVVSWLIGQFLGWSLAALCLLVCLGVLATETWAGLMFGLELHAQNRR